jgi:hypothetical protein
MDPRHATKFFGANPALPEPAFLSQVQGYQAKGPFIPYLVKKTVKMREIVHIQAGQCGNQIGCVCPHDRERSQMPFGTETKRGFPGTTNIILKNVR